MRRIVFVAMLICYSIQIACADDNNAVFPTGMKWKEAFVESGMAIDNSSAVTYEVGGDTIVNGFQYKRILRDGSDEPYLIREENNCVWLLPDELDHELKLYDFNWHGEQTVYMEYLVKSEKGVELESYELKQEGHATTSIGNVVYEYVHDIDGALVCNIGHVSLLGRNSCLLGYMKTEPALPCLIYAKVLWIEKDGKRFFHSDSSEEWITTEPTRINMASFKKSDERGKVYILTGQIRKSTTRQAHIVRMADGSVKKVLVKKFF